MFQIPKIVLFCTFQRIENQFDANHIFIFVQFICLSSITDVRIFDSSLITKFLRYVYERKRKKITDSVCWLCSRFSISSDRSCSENRAKTESIIVFGFLHLIGSTAKNKTSPTMLCS